MVAKIKVGSRVSYLDVTVRVDGEGFGKRARFLGTVVEGPEPGSHLITVRPDPDQVSRGMKPIWGNSQTRLSIRENSVKPV